eukprot:TRINITY_DN1949_c1_g1_i4.p1 TRINITY_DN1949_c1_g1~~TRINITY_DN1949_c1_g1_i4.p1  ORF type:complete len:112 (-),score=18.99 TRINITY_DN1949_c1_g1_i4:57-392(-)
MGTNTLAKALNLKEGIVGSQGSYQVSDIQCKLINIVGVVALDMEAASEAQILQQTGTNFLALKVISNGVYPGEPIRMEKEYVENKLLVSEKSIAVLTQLLTYLVGKTIGEL